MSSLVAYEDSESEDEDEDDTGGEGSAPLQRDFCEKTDECIGERHLLEGTSSPGSSTTDPGTVLECKDSSERRNATPQLPNCSEIKQSRCTGLQGPAAPLPLPATRGRISPEPAGPHTPQKVCHGSVTARRPRAVPPGVRPYIPKRQRLVAPVEEAEWRGAAEQGHSWDRRLLSDVSAKVKLVLTHGSSRAAEAPRRLLLSLGGHQGPVNTLHWCPVPHLSHLLLSASMDKSFKVWDGAESGCCLRSFTCHSGAVRDACWTPCGRNVLTGSFDDTAVITDVETGQQILKADNQFKVMCVAVHPGSPAVFLCGGHSSAVKAWDSRSCKVVKVYKAGIQQTLDILFLRGGTDFITSSDCVSRDSADRTLIAWDFQTTAKISNQIYHERYTCPSLALHPLEDTFVAQTNGDYIAAFSSMRPYRMNKRRQYGGHKVEGYAVQCDFSPDGAILASGSSTGSAHFYDYHKARALHTLQAHSQPCLSVSQHPVLPATAATCDWAGEIKVWHRGP